jgi:hypothetical protein
LLEQPDRITVAVRKVVQRRLLESGSERHRHCMVREAKIGRRLTDGLRVGNLFSVEAVGVGIDSHSAWLSSLWTAPKHDEGCNSGARHHEYGQDEPGYEETLHYWDAMSRPLRITRTAEIERGAAARCAAAHGCPA